MRAIRSAGRSRTRWRRAPVAARPASIHPPNAMTIVVKVAGGSWSNTTLSMIILSAVVGGARHAHNILRLERSAWLPMVRPTEARDVAQGLIAREREPQLGCAGVTVRLASFQAFARGAGDGVAVPHGVVDDTGRAFAHRQASDDGLELFSLEPVVVRSEERRVGKEGRSRWETYE